MDKKQAIIDRLAAIEPGDMEGELRTQLRAAQEEWNSIGHVPFKEKDRLFKSFREQMDRLYGAAAANATRRRVSKFKNDVAEGDTSRIRERLLRQKDILTNEIKTYENNLGFLNLGKKSKSNGLVDELNRKMDKLKADLEEVKEKLAALKKD
jgi:predicted  nucleic acid-binding Zn-ribbon protein